MLTSTTTTTATTITTTTTLFAQTGTTRVAEALASTQMMTTRVMNTSAVGGIDGGGPPASRTTSATITTTATTAPAATTATTTITSDPGILCFHHCNVKVFCFTLPHICPQCKTALDTHPSGNKRHKTKKRTTAAATTTTPTTTNNAESSAAKGHHHLTNGADDNDDNNRHEWENEENDKDSDDDDDDDDDTSNENGFVCHIMASRLLPFRLPYPFVRANQYPCAIVLRPTTGDFLNDYNNTTDLHIAVTTSTGCVVEFDRHGLRRHRTDNMSDWWQCLLVGDVPEPWYDYWDQVLFEICQVPDKWTVSHYHEDKHNCYTFVLTFLQALTYDKLSEAATSKTTFCEKYIVPRTTTAGKYISLYRKLRDTGIYVHHTNHNKLRHASHGKAGKHQQQQQQQQHQQLQQQQHNKFSNSALATAKNALVSSHKQHQQQQQQPHHHQQQPNQQQQQHHSSNHHHSIISRPHSTLCTIEE